MAALLAASRPAEAIELLRDVASTVSEHGDPDLELNVLELIAVAASVVGDHERAVRLAAAADEQRTAARMPLPEPDRVFLDRHLTTSLMTLGDAADGAERAGRALTVAGALAEAVGFSAPGEAAPAAPVAPSGGVSA